MLFHLISLDYWIGSGNYWGEEWKNAVLDMYILYAHTLAQIQQFNLQRCKLHEGKYFGFPVC